MPRFFFHLEDGRSVPDAEGHLLPDLAAARDAAVRMLGQILVDDPLGFVVGGDWRLVVTDEAGVPLFTVSAAIADAAPLHIEIVPNPAG
jgi:hypothetical protein